MVNKEKYKELLSELGDNVTLVAVSKTKSVEEIKELDDLGQRNFGENYVQELTEKYEQLPKDIRWHFIGHLQSNKVKYIAPFVHLIHGVDSMKLLKEINKEGEKNNRTIDCLLQVHIASEETKFGLDEEEVNELISQYANMLMKNVRVCGLMGMASFTEDMEVVREEFRGLKNIYDKCSMLNVECSTFKVLSMGMSADYKVALEEGSNMVRVGSLLFGERSKAN
jgi:PLP dependent protein